MSKIPISMEHALTFCIRVAVAAAASILMLRYAVRYLDPSHNVNAEAKKKVKKIIFIMISLIFNLKCFL